MMDFYDIYPNILQFTQLRGTTLSHLGIKIHEQLKYSLKNYFVPIILFHKRHFFFIKIQYRHDEKMSRHLKCFSIKFSSSDEYA